jgi:hypothetical protein
LREKEKLHKVSHTLNHSFWNVSDFKKKLGLGSKGLNAHKQIMASLVSKNEITFMFGARQPNSWKVSISEFVSEFVSVEDYKTLFKLYEDVYTHPPPKSGYLSVFLHGWLVQ